MADFKPPPLSSHEGPDFTPPPLDSHEGLDLPKAGQPPKVPGLTGPSKMEEAFAPLNQTAGQVKKLASGTRGEKFQAASDIIRSFAPTREDLPFALPAAALVGAAGTAGGIVGGALGGKGARAVTQISGGGSGAQNLAEDVGNLAGGAAGAKLGSGLTWGSFKNAAQDLANYHKGFWSPESVPAGRSGISTPTPAGNPGVLDAAHAVAHPTTGVPALLVKAAKPGRMAAGERARELGRAARDSNSSGYAEGSGHFGETLPEVPLAPRSTRPTPAWEAGPGPQPSPSPDIQPIRGPLPSGRVVGPAPAPPTPPAPPPPITEPTLEEMAVRYQKAPKPPKSLSAPRPGRTSDNLPTKKVISTPSTPVPPAPVELSPDDPGMQVRYRDDIPEGSSISAQTQEAGFGPNPPKPTPETPNAFEATARAKKAKYTAETLFQNQAQVPKESLDALGDPNIPDSVKEPIWKHIESLVYTPKQLKAGSGHSPQTRAEILSRYAALHQDAGTQTPSSPIPKP